MDASLPYRARIADYYKTLGYGEPYRWASFDDVPFAPFRGRLRDARIGIVTTAVPYDPAKGDQGPGAAYNGAAKFFEVYSAPTDTPPDLRIAHIAYDRDHTDATDQRCWFPLTALHHLIKSGEIGGIAPRFHGLPTDRSQRRTREVYVPEIVARCREDGVDGVVLVPNCPVCHQSVTLAARALDEAGIPSVVMGCAKDIVEHVGAPRLLFSDFPLGNGAGPPRDPGAQLATLRMALMLLATARAPRSTWRSPQIWPGRPDWKRDYSNAALLSPEEITARREAFDRAKRDATAQKRDSA